MDRHQRPRKRPTYPEGNRPSLLAAYEESRARGALAIEAAFEVGVPLNTINRWKSNEKQSLLRKEFSDQHDCLNNAMRILYVTPANLETTYLEALFFLVGWLRCSSKPELLDLSVATLLIAFAKQKFGINRLSELPEPWSAVISRHICLSNFLDFCCTAPDEESLPEFPTFFNDLIDDQPYDDRDELAQICWCLLAIGHSSKNRVTSLGKALYLLQQNHFRYQWHVSRRTKEKFWRMHAAAAPFMFIERFHSSLDLSPDPVQPDFLLKIGDLVQNHEAIREFCRRVRFVIERLALTMDARAVHAIRFPAFPDEIVPSDVPIPKLTQSMIQSLGHYRSAER